MKLWIANAVAALLVAVAAIAQPILASSPRCGRSCDPHGYVVIFSALPALVTTLLALAALASLVARRRGGLWVVLVAAVGCGFEWLLLRSLLSIAHNVVIGAVLLATVVLAVAGLRRTRQLVLKSS
ncbi:hypothetical protein [Kribbella albertanoniae]|uniref:Uncharacterized protein n=1 Tax=Kribbella albertanoniae TaxID=1266829 RepID=A0A4R4PCM3_9ACTN|nr:hypothetical protein [Kribbella albertanoniae]TDC18890.1 hypothetical protein E1261_34790 [Kribbella albertanoniae]